MSAFDHKDRCFPGIYRAIVADNNDPNKTGRLLLVVPAVSGKDVIPNWALPITGSMTGLNESGQGIGHIEIPDKNASVWCMFEDGHAHNPLWLGGWWGFPKGVSDVPALAQGGTVGKNDESAKTDPKGTDTMETGFGVTLNEPAPPYAAEYPHNRVIVTKQGIKIEIDDTPGKERVHIWHPRQVWTEMFPDGTKVERVKNDRWVTIEAGSGADGNDRLHVHGNQDIVVEGDATLRVNGNYRVSVAKRYTLMVGGKAVQIYKGDKDERVSGTRQTIIGKDNITHTLGSEIRVGHPIDDTTGKQSIV